MNSRTVATTRTVAAGVVLAALLFSALPGCGSKGAAHATPEDVFKAAKAAADKEDWKGFCDCLTDDSRDTFAGGMAFAGVMMKAFGELGGKEAGAKLKPIDDVLSKHGLTEENFKKMEKAPPLGGGEKEMAKVMKELVAPVKDRGAFVADMVAALKQVGDKGKDQPPFPKDAVLKDVKIDGDTAKAVIVSQQGGAERSEPIAFRKVGAGWKIELPMGPPNLGPN
jgi:hypothetical protein